MGSTPKRGGKTGTGAYDGIIGLNGFGKKGDKKKTFPLFHADQYFKKTGGGKMPFPKSFGGKACFFQHDQPPTILRRKVQGRETAESSGQTKEEEFQNPGKALEGGGLNQSSL